MKTADIKEFEKRIRDTYSAIHREQEESKRVANMLNKEWHTQQNAYFKAQQVVTQPLKSY